MIILDAKRRAACALAIAAGAITLAACGSSQPPLAASSSLTNAVTVKVATASTGSISVETIYAAVVEAKRQVDLVPLATGRIVDLLVDIGAEVNEGQLIAELSHGTLDAQLKQAESALREAQAKLGSVLAGVEPKLHTAQAKLDSALAARNQLLNPSASELEAAESAVATASSSLESATFKLDQLLEPTATDIQLRASAVTTAQSNLENTKTRLALLLDPSATAQQSVLGAVTTAQSNLDNANATLDQLLNPSAADIAAAREAVSTDQSKLSAAQSTVNDTITAELGKGSPSGLKQAWEILLDARVREQSNSETLNDPARNASLTQTELENLQRAVQGDQQIISSQLSTISSNSVIAEEISTALVEENSALTSLETSQEKLKELEEPSQSTLAGARNKVVIYRVALDSANANLAELGDANSGTISLAQNAVDVAQAALDSAEENRAELQNPTLATINLAKSGVEAAQAALDAATSKLNALKNPTLADISAAAAAIASAEQNLALSEPPQSEFAVEAVRASVDKAQAQVDLVNLQLAELKILAPFDGVITRKWLALGALASPQTPIFTLASADFAISTRVRETDINSIQIGQRVNFTSPALPGQTLGLQVDRIAPAGEGNSFSFRVMLEPTEPAPELKPGMSGEVTVTARHDNAVLVPKEALLRKAGRPAVYTVQNNRAELRIVGIGLTGEETVELLGGIRPGEQVVILGHNLLSDGDLLLIE